VINDAGNCYVGTCAPATECKTVSGCGSCTGANDACASYETQLGIQHHCITIPPECGGSASCSCFGAATCLSAVPKLPRVLWAARRLLQLPELLTG
jgi:hypothetical protein